MKIMQNRVCPKCGSENITFQVHQEEKTVTRTRTRYREKGHGCLWWLTIGWFWWVIDLTVWILFFIPRALLHLGRKRKYEGSSRSVTKNKVRYRTACLCQDCGHNWIR